MNAYLRNHMAAVFLSLPVATAMVALPAVVMAQTDAPELRSLKVSSDGGLSAGAELGFTVEGTARAKSHVRIDGVNRDIILKETARGVYTGTYTILSQDRISQTSPIRAIVQAGNRNVVANYTFPVGMATVSVPLADPVKAVVVKEKTKEKTKAKAEKLKIDSFTVDPVAKLEPGAELHFSLNGMAGGAAEVAIPGVAKKVSMHEVNPGVYDATYTLRKQDKPKSTSAMVATLSQGDNFVTAKPGKAKAGAGKAVTAKAPMVLNMQPLQGSSTPRRAIIPISASFDAKGGVNPKSVHILVSGRDVTTGSKITSDAFIYRANLKPGRHMVDVTAADVSGNKVRKTWTFNVTEPGTPGSTKAERCE
jgi:hypothetical protein